MTDPDKRWCPVHRMAGECWKCRMPAPVPDPAPSRYVPFREWIESEEGREVRRRARVEKREPGAEG